MKEIEFIGRAEKEFRKLPRKIQERFALDVDALKNGKKPFSETTNIRESVGPGAIELKRNGRPAHRLVYVEDEDAIYILHAFEKTTNDVDKPAMKTAKIRYKEMVKLIEKRERDRRD